MGTPLYTEKRYTYMLECLYSLAFHFKLMKGRGKYSTANLDKDKPVYVVDTEYGPRINDKSHTIYDVAIVNLADPFSSYFTYLRCDAETFSPMSGDKSITLNDLEKVPIAEELISIFQNNNTGKRPQIHYYSSVFDIALFYESHERYSKKNRPTRKSRIEKLLNEACKKDDVKNQILEYFGDNEDLYNSKILINVEDSKKRFPNFTDEEIKILQSCCTLCIKPDTEFWAFDKTIDYGCDFINERKTISGKLCDIYCQETGYNFQEYRHITLHKALDDTLLLAEIVAQRYFRV
jgi:hypothetical protein